MQAINNEQRPFTYPTRSYPLLGIVISLWLSGLIFIPNLGENYSVDALFVALVWIAPVLFLSLRGRLLNVLAYRRRPFAIYGALAFLFVSGCSCIYSINRDVSLIYWGITVFVFVLCVGLWSAIKGNERQVLGLFSLTSLVGFIYIFIVQFDGVGRFNSIRNPNGIGLMLLSIAACALALRHPILRAVCIAVSCFLIYQTQSRSAMLAVLIVLSVYTCFEWKTMTTANKVIIGLAILGGAIVVAVWYRQSSAETASQVITQALQLDDRLRGATSHFSGRAELWQRAFDAWRDHPVGGIGYRAHESYPGLEIGAHNGYLALLMETGLLGAIPMIILIGSGALELFRQARRNSLIAKIGFSLVIGYLFFCIFERFLLNFGTPTSILVVMFLFIPPLPAIHYSRRSDNPFDASC